MNKRDGIYNLSVRVLLLAAVFTQVSSVHAVDMSFVGRLVTAPNCTITAGPIAVGFGVVDVDKINNPNSASISEEILYSPSCVNLKYNGSYTVGLMIKGKQASFNSRYFATSVEGLAIEINSSDNMDPLPNTAWINKNPAYWPRLYARLVKDSSAVLPTGTFTAVATMVLYVE